MPTFVPTKYYLQQTFIFLFLFKGKVQPDKVNLPQDRFEQAHECLESMTLAQIVLKVYVCDSWEKKSSNEKSTY